MRNNRPLRVGIVGCGYWGSKHLRVFHELAHELCEGRWVALGGGGYAVREVVPRAWTIFFAEMVEQPELAAQLLDPETFPPEPVAQERVWAMLERDLRDLARHHELELSLER